MNDPNSNQPILLGDTPPVEEPAQPTIPPMPTVQYGGQAGNPGGFNPNQLPSSGMVYNPTVPQAPTFKAPSAGMRFLRGFEMLPC